MESNLSEHSVSAPTRELLSWVSSRPRTYTETIGAWRSSCPRLTVWEDALTDGLVCIVRDGNGQSPSVTLTARGRAVLAAR